MDAKEFLSLIDNHSATLAAQTAAQEEHRGRDAALRERAVCVVELATAVKNLAQAESDVGGRDAVPLDMAIRLTEAKNAAAAAQAHVDAPECCAALASKQALAAAEAAHRENAAALYGILAQRPAAVLSGVVTGHGAGLAAALNAGAELVIPEAWPTVFPVGARLVINDGAVIIDPAWIKAEEIADLEAELALIESAANRPGEIAKRIAELKGA